MAQNLNNLSDAELDSLVIQKMAAPVAPIGDINSLSDDELDNLVAQKISSRPQINKDEEASLGFINRAKYALEPLQSNREALLVQQFGKENVSNDPELGLMLRQNGANLPVDKPGFSAANIADIAGATPEMLGAGAGAIFGAGALSVPAAIAGGIAGSGIRQGLSAAIGTPQVAGMKERAIETGLSGLFSAAVPAAGQTLKVAAPVAGKALNAIGDLPIIRNIGNVAKSGYEAAEGVIKTLRKDFSSGVSPDYKKFAEIATKHNISTDILPEAVEFGKESIVSRASRQLAEGPFGEKRLKNFYKAQDEVAGAIDKSFDIISPSNLDDKIEAGSFIRDSIKKVSDQVLDNDEITYGKLLSEIPDINLSRGSKAAVTRKLNDAMRSAQDRIRLGGGSQVKEGKNLMQFVNALKRSEGNMADTVVALRNIGEEAFKNDPFGVREPVDKKILKDLYNTYREQIKNTLETEYGDYGKEMVSSLVENNKKITSLLRNKEVLSGALDKTNEGPEQIFKSLVLKGDSKKLDTLREMLPPEDFQAIKKSFLKTVVEKNADDRVLYGKTYKNFMKKNDIIKRYYNDGEIKDFADLLSLGKRMGEPVLSSSGTGASASISEIGKQAQRAATLEAGVDLYKKKGRDAAKNAVKKKLSKTSSEGGMSNKFYQAKSSGLSNLFSDDRTREYSKDKNKK